MYLPNQRFLMNQRFQYCLKCHLNQTYPMTRSHRMYQRNPRFPNYPAFHYYPMFLMNLFDQRFQNFLFVHSFLTNQIRLEDP